jgi:hypothetical protein
MRNPHRNQWVRPLGEKHRRCGACGFTAKSVREQNDHADFYEPLATRRPR